MKRLFLKFGLPLDILGNVPLDEADPKGSPAPVARFQLVQPPLTVTCGHRHEKARGEDFFQGGFEITVEESLKEPEEGGVDQHDEKRDAVDPGDVRDLNQGESQELGIPQKGPRKPGEKGAPQVFQRNPQGGRQENVGEIDFRFRPAKDECEGRKKKGEIGGQDKEEENAYGPGQMAVMGEHVVNPGQDPGEKGEPGNPPQKSGPGGRSVAERPKKRNKADPRQRLVIEIREGEDEEESGEAGQGNLIELHERRSTPDLDHGEMAPFHHSPDGVVAEGFIAQRLPQLIGQILVAGAGAQERL